MTVIDVNVATTCVIAFVVGVVATKIYVSRYQPSASVKQHDIKTVDDPILQDDLYSEDSEDDDDEYETESDEDERCKLVLVVRTDLKMGSGKIAAQCGHATLGAFRDVLRKYRKNKSTKNHLDWLKSWDESGCAKIAVQVKSLDDMERIYKAAKDAGLPVHKVIDAGKTQIAPNTKTVVAVGPAPESKVNQITGSLKLL
ncbi:peptidyl-tRNA hydrolase [Acrasis kona]|uniref:peptidyl-tRNA hydrolase n=1 Tax=Acrasis kona TaxID=1008807 RepID=A0AAW2YKT7_9EUKA